LIHFIKRFRLRDNQSLKMPQRRGSGGNDSGVWLTFLNRKLLSEDRIREVFRSYGGIRECDGAVGGKAEGWVMVSMENMDKANSAIKGLRDCRNPIGETIKHMNLDSSGNGPGKYMDDWAGEDKFVENVKIVTKRHSNDHDNPAAIDSSHELLSSSDVGEVGGIKNFAAMSSKILEVVSHNNNLLMERLRESEEEYNRKLKEKDDQIRRQQNMITNFEETIRKLTQTANSNQEFETKVKKFLGENEDFYKKKVAELNKRIEEIEKARFEKMLEESDSSKVRHEVEKLTNATDSILSKTEQVYAVVQGIDLGTVVKSDGKGGEIKVDSMSGNTALLHNKIDKSIRLLAETSENQKKMNKVLQDLIKYTGLMNQDKETVEVEEKKKKKKDKERDRSRGRKRSRSRSTEKRRRSRSGSGDRVKMPAVMPPSSIDHEFEEMKWGLNMTLIGDGHWKSLMMVDDIKNIVDRMTKKVNFKVMCNDSENLASMYEEERDTLMVALPKSCYKVGISIGSYELGDPSLLTLKDGPLDEVRRRNEPKLNQKARILKEMVLNLIRQNKQVIVMIPPHGEARMELFQHWEDILLQKLRDIRFPSIKILNMNQIMLGTMGEFTNEQEYFDMWLRPMPKPRRMLSPYGTRRMFYALRQTVTSKNPAQAGMKDWPTPQSHPPPPTAVTMSQQLPTPTPAHAPPTHQGRMMSNQAPIAQQRIDEFPCARCTRIGHSSDDCKSKDKCCRICNHVGHFVEVHDVTDQRFRQVIVKTLGIDLWDPRRGGNNDQDYKRMRRGPLDHHPDTSIPPLGYGGGGYGHGRGGFY